MNDLLPHTHNLFSANTSCGLTLKSLLKTPLYCDGSTVVILTSVPGGSSSNAARSLFGSGTSLASLRCEYNTQFNIWNTTWKDFHATSKDTKETTVRVHICSFPFQLWRAICVSMRMTDSSSADQTSLMPRPVLLRGARQ